MQVGIVWLSSELIWGSLSDRFGRKIVFVCVFALPALMASLAGDTFGPRLAPAALNLMTIIFGIGQALGPRCAGAIADRTNSFSIAFIIAGAVALIVGAGGALMVFPDKED